MWIIPKNLQLSHFVPDTVESREDLSLLGPELESSLMWRSKPSRLRTWLLRWNRVSWMRHLFTRILKPSQQATFAEKWTSSLEDIHVNRSQLLGKGLGKKTHDTCGRTSSNTSEQLTLFDVSGRTSQVISTGDSKTSSKTWKEKVTEQRGEYSRRQKLGQGIEEKGYSSWPTPTARDYKGARSPEAMAATGRNPMTNSLPDAVQHIEKTSGPLNPQWVEWLMGLPIGWTDLGCWGTE